MVFIIIDGDDIGRKITSCYISNDESRLAQISIDMSRAVVAISRLLDKMGFRVIFCAADGVVGANENPINADKLLDQIRELAPKGITFSAGTGQSLQQAYLALTHAKCSGKNMHVDYEIIHQEPI
ncbi:mCpol domain-containing protein [Sorangium sp. So ce887]|uniref:mCpol domain-containing protein n=1 Tax=Sorangium sp. So ce887 TaxID=3133324 RepID=UPI003F608139